ncbi:thiamine-phosphate kinase [Paramagnetospirillum magneticum]|uniref:thiamine-phosphate kinase n=1 Tax=Paramagnetospirillum magneticum TaxID=84159 RepID=UPI002AC319D7|nr:AIR synthase-related protein [Paramagnetospirillum magneticum]
MKAIRHQLPGLSAVHQEFLTGRYRLPQPRVGLGPRLVGLAHGAMDVSDGLVQDLGHLCRASGLAARIEAAQVPLSPAAAAALGRDQSLLASVLAGGDDYEVLFTAAPGASPDVDRMAAELGLALTAIGSLGEGEPGTVAVIGPDGENVPVGQGGWRHFGGMQQGE